MADPIIVPRRREDIIDDKGNLTLRFTRFLESLTETTNTTSVIIVDNSEGIAENAANIAINAGLIDETPTYSGFMAQVQFLQRQFDGLPELTIDTSGFTTDLTLITTDKVIA